MGKRKEIELAALATAGRGAAEALSALLYHPATMERGQAFKALESLRSALAPYAPPRLYLYRRGDGNEGNFPRYLVELHGAESEWAALPALVASDYRHGRVRRHIMREIKTEGEGGEYGISARVDYAPDGGQAFESCWLTAELQPIAESDREWAEERHGRQVDGGRAWRLRELLDPAAWRYYRAEVTSD